MKSIHELREQIDACRPGSDDLALPELNELAEVARQDRAVADELASSQEFDRAVASALQDISIPAGLADRLITSTTSELVTPAATNDQAATVRLRLIASRRQWLLAGGSLAIVALIALSYQFFLRPARFVSQDELASSVAAWPSQMDASAWQTMAILPGGVAIDPAVAASPRQWQRFTFANSSGWSAGITAINLVPPGQPEAILFVVRSSARFEVSSAPLTTRWSLSGGFTATAWQRQSSGLLYVVVVKEEDGRRLDDYVRRRTEA